jgi:hypothetical protein
MLLKHVWGLISQPELEWEAIREEQCTIGKCYISHTVILAALPAISTYIGATRVGWRIGSGEVTRLTTDSALLISMAFYFALLFGVFIMGRAIYWMANNFGAQVSLEKSVVFAAYTATPLFLVGVMALYPLLWLNMLIGLVALAYTIFLLYTGVPIVMRVTREQGFLFASAVLTVGLVTLVGMLAVTVLLWGFGIGPEFTR